MQVFILKIIFMMKQLIVTRKKISKKMTNQLKKTYTKPYTSKEKTLTVIAKTEYHYQSAEMFTKITTFPVKTR